MPYFLIVALQIFCAYHVYKTRNHYYWYFAIILIPVLGCIFYILTQMISKRDVDVVQKELTTIINPTKKVRDLERKLEFSDTFQNKIDLADAYFEIKDYASAITHYKSALEGFHKNDFYTLSQLVICLYEQGAYQELIDLITPHQSHADFSKSKTQFLLGLALDFTAKPEEAEKHLNAINLRYSFYEERLHLANFYLTHHKEEKAIAIIKTLYNEMQNMTPMNRKKYRATITEVNRAYTEHIE